MTDTKELLAAWGYWTNERSNLSCQSPSLLLMRSAPFHDDSDTITKRKAVLYISDDDALRVDKAVGDLKRLGARLDALLGYYSDNNDMSFLSDAMRWRVIDRHFRHGMTLSEIACDINKLLGKRLFSAVRVTRVLESGIGFVEGRLMD